MGHSQNVRVKELPAWITSALGRKVDSVRVTPATDVGIVDYGGQGYRATVSFIYSTGTEIDPAFVGHWTGSFGGPNMATKNRVDGTDPKYGREERATLRPGFAVVRNGRTVLLHPEDYARLVPIRSNPLTKTEHAVLRAYSMKAGDYRNDALRRTFPCAHDNTDISGERSCCYRDACFAALKPQIDAVLARFVEKKLVKRNTRGAVSITPEGLNAMSGPVYEPTLGDETYIALEIGSGEAETEAARALRLAREGREARASIGGRS